MFADNFIMQLAIWRHLALIICVAAAWSVCACPTDASNIFRLSKTPWIQDCRIGFDGSYKVGHWTPVRVTVKQGLELTPFEVQVEVKDGDGVSTTVARIIEAAAETATLITSLEAKVGKLGSAIRVRLLVDGKPVDERTLRPGIKSDDATAISDVPATGELVVALASSSFGLQEALIDRPAEDGLPARRVVQLSKSDDLPANWIGYEGVDLLILTAGDGGLPQELAADRPRFSAMIKWVEMGGKLALICGGRAAKELLAEGRPLATLVPGRLVDYDRAAVPRLSDSIALEHFAQSEAVIVAPGSGGELLVAQLADVSGRVELYGAGAAQLPLVIRAPRGLGEITFVGVDLDAAPIAGWPGRTSFLRALLRPLTASDDAGDSSRKLVTMGYDDLNGALRQRLGQAFAGVRPMSFQSVVGLSILYLLILGPLDYLIVRKWLRRPGLAWISFPLILLMFGTGALVLANSRNESARRAVLNQVELVDIDVATSQARGTFWATLYSPQAQRLDLQFVPRYMSDSLDPASSILSAHGLAGSGIGGMSGAGPVLGHVSADYHQASSSRLDGVPVLTAGTKSLSARWSAPTTSSIAAQLRDDESMLAGTITNQTGTTLRNARLLYGSWAYRLKDLEPGAMRELNEDVAPIAVQTLVTGLALGSPLGGRSTAERALLPTDQASAAELLNVMMFYNASGGAGFAGLPFRYQSYCDLSRQLELGRAVLVAEVPTSGSQLTEIDDVQQLGMSDGDNIALTIYRFVLPITLPNR